MDCCRCKDDKHFNITFSPTVRDFYMYVESLKTRNISHGWFNMMIDSRKYVAVTSVGEESEQVHHKVKIYAILETIWNKEIKEMKDRRD